MKIYRIPVGELLANCYIIETENKNAVAIDPGSDFQRIKNLLDEHELTLKKILLTHGHYDHIGAAGEAAHRFIYMKKMRLCLQVVQKVWLTQ